MSYVYLVCLSVMYACLSAMHACLSCICLSAMYACLSDMLTCLSRYICLSAMHACLPVCLPYLFATSVCRSTDTHTNHLCCIAHKKNIFFRRFGGLIDNWNHLYLLIFPVGHSVIML